MSGMVMKWHGDVAKRRAKQGAADGLSRAAEYLLEKSQPLVPVAPVGGGYLRDAGVASVDKGALRAAVSYITGPTVADGRMGGGNLAVVVHEDMGAHHLTGHSKYLEQPFNSEKQNLIRIMGGGVASALDPGKEMISYTSKAGVTSMRTRSEVANYTRNKTTS